MCLKNVRLGSQGHASDTFLFSYLHASTYLPKSPFVGSLCLCATSASESVSLYTAERKQDSADQITVLATCKYKYQ